jgi:glycerophosphoryl diester phosphodiesterase
MKLFLLLIVAITTSCASRNKTVIAHRGAPGYLPEHTLAGVAMAHGWGVDFIEPDIVITKDHKAVVLHDIHIDTTTNVTKIFPNRKRKDGRYYAVDFTLKEIKTLNVNERINLKTGKKVFHNRFDLNQSKFKVPTFVEFIELVQGLNKSTGRDIGIYPEIKSPEFHAKEKKDITKITFNILKKYGYNSKKANIFVQCFYPPTLKRLRSEFNAQMPLIALIAENDWKESSIDYDELRTEKGIKELSSYVDGIGPYLKHLIISKPGVNFIQSDLVNFAHKNGLKVHPYTHRVDSLPEYFTDNKKLFDFLYNKVGVDGIFSDFGDVALRYSK